MNIITRFAPSPTGKIHLGNARIAFLNFLFAKKYNGKFFIRIEDTDQKRSKNIYKEMLIKDLIWLKYITKEDKIYYQSDRKNKYSKYIKILINKKFVYPCFCSKNTLLQEKKHAIKNNIPYKYSQRCLLLSKDIVEKKKNNNVKYILRFNIQKIDISSIYYVDIFKGKKSIVLKYLSDFVIKNNNNYSFIFCNAVDDGLMKTTHIIRGEDHITNTIKQIIILYALEMKIPYYGHIPLMVNNNGKPYSKRDNDNIHLQYFKTHGFSSEAINNYLFRLGNKQNISNYLLNIKNMVQIFDKEIINCSSIKFNIDHLYYWQKKYIKNFIKDYDFSSKNDIKISDKRKNKFINLIKDNILFLYEIIDLQNNLLFNKVIFTKESLDFIKKLEKKFILDFLNIFKKCNINIEDIKNNIYTKHLNKKKCFMLLRILITGKVKGPKLFDIISFLPKEEVIKRILYVKNF